MSGSNARSNAIRAITSYKPDLAPLNYADTKPTEIYGSNVFSGSSTSPCARPSSRGSNSILRWRTSWLPP